MSGLLKKAIPLHENFLDKFEIDSIPLADREMIYEEIDDAIALGKMPISDDTFRFQALKKDTTLPFLVNLAAFIVTISIGTFLYSYFQTAEQSIISKSGTLNLTENQIITALKKESEQKLSEKESEIRHIQSEMGRIVEEQSLLLLSSESKIERLEKALRERLDKALLQEQETLQRQGLNPEEVELRISELTLQLEEDFQKERIEIFNQVENERLQKEQELISQIAGYERSLTRAREEQDLLQGSLDRQIEELESRYTQQDEATRQRYEALLEQNREEQFLLNQISESYRETTLSIQDGNYTAAAAGIEELEAFIMDEKIQGYPNIMARKSTDMILLESLKNLISLDRESRDDKIGDLLILAAEQINRGNDLYNIDSFDEARAAYLKAMALIPSIETGYERLQSLEALEQRRRRELFLLLVREGDMAFSEQNMERAILKYQTALESLTERDPLIAEIVQNLVQAGTPLVTVTEEEIALLNEAKERQKSRDRLLATLEELKQSIESSEKSFRESDKELVELLSTKVLIKEVLSSESVRHEYPELHKQLELYLEAYGQFQENSGKALALVDMTIILKNLEKGRTGRSPELDEIQAKLYLRLLSSLKVIIEH